METCATHGLQYDPAKHDGCVLCHRLKLKSGEAPIQPSPHGALLSALGFVALVASIGWVLLRDKRTIRLAPEVPVKAEFCVDSCSRFAEDCVKDPPRSEDGSRRQCLRQLERCLGRCSALPPVPPSTLSLVYALSDQLPWSQLKQQVQIPNEKFAACLEAESSSFTARLEVSRDSRVVRATAGDNRGTVIPCVENPLRELDASRLPKGNYALVVRGNLPALPARKPRTDSPKLGAGAAAKQIQAVDYQALVDKMNPGNPPSLPPAAAQPKELPTTGYYSRPDPSTLPSGEELEAYDQDGITPLTAAILHGRPGAALSMIENGANVNGTSEGDVSPLHIAAGVGDNVLVNTLLDRGADINHQSMSGKTALMCAVEADRMQIVPLLIDRGAKLELADEKGDTALIRVARVRNRWTMSTLISRGAKLEARNDKGMTALMVAADMGAAPNLSELLKAGAKVNAVDDKGVSALDYASRPSPGFSALELSQHDACVQTLLLVYRADAKSLLAHDASSGWSEKRIGQELIEKMARQAETGTPASRP